MAQKAMDTWSEEMAKRFMAPEEPPDALKEAYDILGVSPACSDMRAAYRAADSCDKLLTQAESSGNLLGRGRHSPRQIKDDKNI